MSFENQSLREIMRFDEVDLTVLTVVEAHETRVKNFLKFHII